MLTPFNHIINDIIKEKNNNDYFKKIAEKAIDKDLIQAATAYAFNDFRYWPWDAELWLPGPVEHNLKMAIVLLSIDLEKRLANGTKSSPA